MSKRVAEKIEHLNYVIENLNRKLKIVEGENENLHWTIEMNAKGTNEIRKMLEDEKKNIKTESVEVPVDPTISIIDNTGSEVSILKRGDKFIIEITKIDSGWL